MTRHCFFSIKKCGESACTICRPPRCSPEDFEQLYHLSDPIPGEDLHYKSFEELYGKQTSEDHRPSLKDAKTKTKKEKKTRQYCENSWIQFSTLAVCHFVIHAILQWPYRQNDQT